MFFIRVPFGVFKCRFELGIVCIVLLIGSVLFVSVFHKHRYLYLLSSGSGASSVIFAFMGPIHCFRYKKHVDKQDGEQDPIGKKNDDKYSAHFDAMKIDKI